MDRRSFSASLAASLMLPAMARGQAAWPQGRNIKLVVPFAAGGATDIIARIMADKLGQMWNCSIVVDNKGGAGGNIGTEAAARAEPNGETFLLVSVGLATNPYLYPKLGYDPVGDFAPVSLVAMVPNMLIAGKHLPVKNVAELIAYGKANPGKLTYASSGVGTSRAKISRSRTGIGLMDRREFSDMERPISLAAPPRRDQRHTLRAQGRH
jgi:tripartite-type tricarboxylate transporter receptor subunit TctC